MKFPCTSCGCCCKRVGHIAKTLPPSLSFPYKYDESGKCEMLTDDNLCSVYENRPIVCNMEKMMDYLGVTEKELYPNQIKMCNKMMDEDGVDESFRILVSP